MKRVAAASALILLALAACTSDPPEQAPAPTGPIPTPDTPSSVGPATEEEVGTSWDEVPDTPVAPESELTDAERLEHLRLAATDPPGEDACEPADLTGQLRHLDSALGTRAGPLLIRNDGTEPCTLSGYPGIGARGDRGHMFHVEVTQEPDTTTQELRLAPGDVAQVPVRWTGELAGAGAERAETLYVQLFRDEPPLPVALGPQPLVEDLDDPGTVDIGTFTTVYVGPVGPPSSSALTPRGELP